MPNQYHYIINFHLTIMQLSKQLKQGNIMSFKVVQNTANYEVRIAMCPKGLWVCIQQLGCHWKATISEESVSMTTKKASNEQQELSLKQFIEALLGGLKKCSPKWSVGVMTPIELEVLRGNSSKNLSSSKIYMILSDVENKFHYPFTLELTNMNQKEKLIEAIQKMKSELEELKVNNDKSQTSFSILSEVNQATEQMQIENQQIKKRIKIYEETLTQKRGAVEIDLILKEKNNLQLLAENRKREELKEINRLKGVHSLLLKESQQIKQQIQFIYRETSLLEDSVTNPAKLKSHALRILKNYELQLRNSKKVTTKQVREIDNLRRNINTAKNTEKRILAKIKQLHTEIQDAKKKANLKEISNRLSQGKGPSSRGSSSKAPSVSSKESNGQKVEGNRVRANNLVRQNLLKKVSEPSKDKNNLLRTSPMMHSPVVSAKQNIATTLNRPPVSSHQIDNRQYQNRGTSVRSNSNNSHHSPASNQKKTLTPQEKEKQRLAIQRLTAPKKTSTEYKGNTISQKNIVGKSLNNKPFSKNKGENTKDMLSKMKQIKAKYNARSQNNNKTNALSNKVIQLTAQGIPK